MTGIHHGLTRFDQLMHVCLHGEGPAQPPLARVLGRMFKANPVQTKNISHADVIEALDKLSQTMRATSNADGPADAGMTFLGQFVDHDMTLDATSALGSRIDPRTIPNLRTPALDLDCVYGAGPEGSPYLYGSGAHEHYLMMGRHENHRDLARTCAGKALIGDPRNDENVIVAQIQGLFIELHNILMGFVEEGGDAARDIKACAHEGMSKQVWEEHVKPRFTSFQEVRRFIRLHYQWIVWNELLPAFVDKDWLHKAKTGHIFKHEDLVEGEAPVMPVEFSGACYRFGHATTQFEYRFKDGAAPVGLFDIMGFGKRPVEGNLDLAMFFQTKDGPKAQHARPVGPFLGAPLFELPFVHSGIHLPDIDVAMTPKQAQNLALRNMIRDRYTYQLASGQQVAGLLGLPTVPVPDALKHKGITKTPLWFYALQEAETKGNGRLTGVGAAIVATVFANVLERDKTTVAHIPHFQPWSGFGGHPSCIAGLVAFVEKHRDQIVDREKLMCG